VLNAIPVTVVAARATPEDGTARGSDAAVPAASTG
jgi:hypothetical protein